MPALNFSPQFADLVKTGRKLQTVRKPRKRPIRIGETVSLYTGQRTKECRRLGKGIVYWIGWIKISEDVLLLDGFRQEDPDRFARHDGFKDFSEMKDWFRERYGLPFTGEVIHWKLIQEKEG